MAYRLAGLDKQFELAACRIQAIVRSIMTRRKTRRMILARKRAMIFMQCYIRSRLLARKKRAKRELAATIVARFCKGYLVTKRFVKARGSISIDQTLKPLKEMRD